MLKHNAVQLAIALEKLKVLHDSQSNIMKIRGMLLFDVWGFNCAGFSAYGGIGKSQKLPKYIILEEWADHIRNLRFE